VSDPQDRTPDTSSGIELMVIGALIAGLCGACTWGVVRSNEVIATLFVVGLVPIGIGLFLFALGFRHFLERRR
jgi:dipeptide/tripeptide permease